MIAHVARWFRDRLLRKKREPMRLAELLPAYQSCKACGMFCAAQIPDEMKSLSLYSWTSAMRCPECGVVGAWELIKPPAKEPLLTIPPPSSGDYAIFQDAVERDLREMAEAAGVPRELGHVLTYDPKRGPAPSNVTKIEPIVVPRPPDVSTAKFREALSWQSDPDHVMPIRVRDVEALVSRMEAVEEWACSNVEGDGLRAILWPERGE